MYAKRKEFRLQLERVVDVAREYAEEAEYSEEELWEQSSQVAEAPNTPIIYLINITKR